MTTAIDMYVAALIPVDLAGDEDFTCWRCKRCGVAPLFGEKLPGRSTLSRTPPEAEYLESLESHALRARAAIKPQAPA